MFSFLSGSTETQFFCLFAWKSHAATLITKAGQTLLFKQMFMWLTTRENYSVLNQSVLEIFSIDFLFVCLFVCSGKTSGVGPDGVVPQIKAERQLGLPAVQLESGCGGVLDW